MNQTNRSILTPIVALIFSLLALFLVLPMQGHAEEGTLQFYVTPKLPESQVEGTQNYFNLNLAPGKTEKLALHLQNGSEQPVTVSVTPHAAYTNVHGVVEYGKDAKDPDPTLTHGLDQLIDPIDDIELAGKQTKTVELTLHMPKESFAGLLAGGLRISEVKEPEKKEDSEKAGLAIKNEFAYVLGVVLSNSRDAVTPDLDLIDVFSDQLNYRNVFSAAIQNPTATFVNHLAVEAQVQRVGDDELVYQASKEEMQMAPNSHFNFPISLEGDRFRAGDYIATVKATSGEEVWEWEKKFTIKADEAKTWNKQDVTIDQSTNWWMIGTVTLLVILIIVINYCVWQVKKQKS